jgi:hypothetical protein
MEMDWEFLENIAAQARIDSVYSPALANGFNPWTEHAEVHQLQQQLAMIGS